MAAAPSIAPSVSTRVERASWSVMREESCPLRSNAALTSSGVIFLTRLRIRAFAVALGDFAASSRGSIIGSRIASRKASPQLTSPLAQ